MYECIFVIAGLRYVIEGQKSLRIKNKEDANHRSSMYVYVWGSCSHRGHRPQSSVW